MLYAEQGKFPAASSRVWTCPIPILLDYRKFERLHVWPQFVPTNERTNEHTARASTSGTAYVLSWYSYVCRWCVGYAVCYELCVVGNKELMMPMSGQKNKKSKQQILFLWAQLLPCHTRPGACSYGFSYITCSLSILPAENKCFLCAPRMHTKHTGMTRHAAQP